MIMARVVLPSPGGPESSTWSAVAFRCRAASRTSPSWERTRSWPMKSARLRGRSAPSAAMSSSSASPAQQLVVAHARSRWRRAERSSAGHGRVTALGQDGLRLALHRLGGGAGVPRRPAQGDEAVDDRGRPVVGGHRWRPSSEVGAPRRSLSSRAIRAAPLRPIPGGLDRVTRSSVATAARSWSTVSTARIAWAVRGPMPVTDCSTSNACRSSSSTKPNRVRESSRTTSAVATWAGAPGPQLGQRARTAQQGQPHAADVDDGVVGAHRGDGAVHEGDHRAPPARSPTAGRARGHGAGRARRRLRGARGTRVGIREGAEAATAEAMRALADPRQTWQIARARASVASTGFGARLQAQDPHHHPGHLGLVGAPGAGHGRLHLAGRVPRDRQPRLGRSEDRRRGRLGGAHDGVQVVLAEHPLDGDDVRGQLLDELLDAPADHEQPLRQRIGRRRGDHLDVPEGQRPAEGALDEAHAAPGQARIDPEYAHATSRYEQVFAPYRERGARHAARHACAAGPAPPRQPVTATCALLRRHRVAGVHRMAHDLGEPGADALDEQLPVGDGGIVHRDPDARRCPRRTAA